MNELLDARRLPEQDRSLIEHARVCEDCACTLETQRQVFQCMHVRPTRSWRARPNHLPLGIAAVSAALVLLVVSLDAPPEEESSSFTMDLATEATDLISTPQVVPHSPNLLAGLMHGDFSNLLPEETHLTDTAWLDQVSGGVRPLTDSMTSTLKVLRRTWPSTGPRSQALETAPVTGAGTS